MNRRHFTTLALGALPALRAHADTAIPRYRVAVCDWMILKRQKLGAFQLAKDIGADGVEVDMGGLGERETFDNQLTTNEACRGFLDKATELGLSIPSVAMSGFYAQSFAERPTVPRMIADCIATMQRLEVKVAFLPLGVKGDLPGCGPLCWSVSKRRENWRRQRVSPSGWRLRCPPRRRRNCWMKLARPG
jgi:hypothetical protein